MAIFGKSVSFLWVLILVLSSANNSMVSAELVIMEVTNRLDNGSLDLTVACPNIDNKSYLLHPGQFHQWINNADSSPSGGPIFKCSFQWKGASHIFNLYNPARDFDCEECHWYIKETGPCRVYDRPNKPTICSNWDS